SRLSHDGVDEKLCIHGPHCSKESRRLLVACGPPGTSPQKWRAVIHRAGMGALERRPQRTKSESPMSTKLRGVSDASPRDKWKPAAHTCSATQPAAASTVK